MVEYAPAYEFGFRAESYRKQMTSAQRVEFDRIAENGKTLLLAAHEDRAAHREERVERIKRHLYEQATLNRRSLRPPDTPARRMPKENEIDRRARAIEAGHAERIVSEVKRATRQALERHIEKSLGKSPRQWEREL